MTMKMTSITIPASRPRNPLVRAARFRQAGVHGGRPGTDRRAAQRALRHELRSLPADGRGRPPSP
jgi:hypothetical protein